MKNPDLRRAFAPAPPRFHAHMQEALRALPAAAPRRPMRRRAALIAALIGALLLAGAALAASRGLFGLLGREGLDQIAQPSDVAIDIPVPGADQPLRFELLQSYYDGEQIFISYQLRAPRDIDWAYVPSAEALAQMERVDNLAIPVEFSSEEWDRLLAGLKRDGRAGFALYHSPYISDGIYLSSGERLSWDGADQWQGDVLIGYRELYGPLPEAARNLGGVDLILRLKWEDANYGYIDQSGIYARHELGAAAIELPVHVPRNPGKVTYCRADARFASYSAHAELAVSEASLHASLLIDAPEAWYAGQGGKITEYLLLVDGRAQESRQSGSAIWTRPAAGEKMDAWIDNPAIAMDSALDRAFVFELSCEGVPAGAKELRLRPIYQDGAARPEEDIVIHLSDGA